MAATYVITQTRITFELSPNVFGHVQLPGFPHPLFKVK